MFLFFQLTPLLWVTFLLILFHPVSTFEFKIPPCRRWITVSQQLTRLFFALRPSREALAGEKKGRRRRVRGEGAGLIIQKDLQKGLKTYGYIWNRKHAEKRDKNNCHFTHIEIFHVKSSSPVCEGQCSCLTGHGLLLLWPVGQQKITMTEDPNSGDSQNLLMVGESHD